MTSFSVDRNVKITRVPAEDVTGGVSSHTPVTPQGFGALSGSQGSGSFSSGRVPTIFLGVADKQGPRPYMEDRHTLIKNFKLSQPDDVHRVFLAVYDGHASTHGSEYASSRLHEILAAKPAVSHCKGGDGPGEVEAMEQALKAAFEDVDEEIIKQAENKGKRYGTTAVCALVVGRILYVAHCGDSKAVLFRDGAAVELTRDHKPASDPLERARIEAQGGEIDYGSDRVISNPQAGHRQSRLNMSRALGDGDHKFPKRLVEAEPDVCRIPLTPGKNYFLVLGSDGLFDVLSPGQVGRIVKQMLDASGRSDGDAVAGAAADALVSEALRLGTNDNVTAVVANFQWS